MVYFILLPRNDISEMENEIVLTRVNSVLTRRHCKRGESLFGICSNVDKKMNRETSSQNSTNRVDEALIDLIG